MTQIQKTQDYTLFKNIVGNRPIRKAHVNNLARSIEEKPELIEANPILVNKNWEIIDGQHRLEALKVLEMPIYFIQLDDHNLDDVRSLNTNSKNWTLSDYANSYASQGVESYKVYLGLVNKYKLGKTNAAQFMMLDKVCTVGLFKAGKLKIVDLPRTIRLIHEFLEVAVYCADFYNTKGFSTAFLRMWLNQKYNHQEMMKKISKHHTKMETRGRVIDYVRDLEAVFNTGRSDLTSVRFD